MKRKADHVMVLIERRVLVLLAGLLSEEIGGDCKCDKPGCKKRGLYTVSGGWSACRKHAINHAIWCKQEGFDGEVCLDTETLALRRARTLVLEGLKRKRAA